MPIPARALLSALAALCAAGCASDDLALQEPVMGTLRSRELAPVRTPLFTEPAAAGGVRLATAAGQGRRSVTLSPGETGRLIAGLQSALSSWPRGSRTPPFRRTVMFGAASTDRPNPFSVELVKRPDLAEPVLLVSLAYVDAFAFFAIDRENTRLWLKRLRQVSGR